jgi:hypothetical protein
LIITVRLKPDTTRITASDGRSAEAFALRENGSTVAAPIDGVSR